MARITRTESSKDFIRRKSVKFKRERARRKPVGMKDIGRKGRHRWLREAWTFMPQSKISDRKVFVVERLRRMRPEGRTFNRRRNRVGDIEYRIGYFVVGRNGNKRGRWIWGQFCPLIPKDDFRELLRKAKDERTLL